MKVIEPPGRLPHIHVAMMKKKVKIIVDCAEIDIVMLVLVLTFTRNIEKI